MDNALVPDQAIDWSVSLKPGSWNSAECTFAKSSGIVTKDREKDWPIADWRHPSNDPINNRGSNFFCNKKNCSLFLSRRSGTFVCILSAFPKKISTTFEKCRKYSGDFWSLPNDAVSSPSNRSRHLTFRTTDWNILGGDWIQVLQFNGLWQVVRNFESRIDVFHLSWLCNELVTLVDSGFVKGHYVN